MANLLPPFARKQLIREYWVRVLTLTLFMLAVVLLAIAIMLLPTYRTLSTQVAAMQDSLEDAEVEQARITASLTELQTTNRLLSYLRDVPATPSFTHYYYELQAIAGPGILITSINIQTNERVVSAVDMVAIASTRQGLIDFLDDLQRHPEFGRVAVPIENLAQSENIEFSVRIPVILTADS